MLMTHWRKVLLCSCLFAAVAALGTGLARVAAKSATEAPAGFNTPSFNSTQSISNGIIEPPGDTFARDQQVYEENKALLAAGFPRVYLFRPAYIYPVEPRKEPNFNYRLIRAIYPVFRVLFPSQVIRADDLARAMVDVVLRKTQERQGVVFENRDIRSMVGSRTPLTNRAA